MFEHGMIHTGRTEPHIDTRVAFVLAKQSCMHVRDKSLEFPISFLSFILNPGGPQKLCLLWSNVWA
jgi:hypothetical protein